MLERLGVNTRGTTMQTKNVAAVMVTAKPSRLRRARARASTFRCRAMGDAKNLAGRHLAGDDPVRRRRPDLCAWPRGRWRSAAFPPRAMPPASRAACRPPGRIANGAIVEREIGFHACQPEHTLKLSLHNPDLTTATRIATAVNAYIGGTVARGNGPLQCPASPCPPIIPGGVMGLLTDIEQVKVDPDQPARVVIDEDSPA